MHRIYTFLIFISQLALGLSNNPDIPIQYELANNIMENYQKGLIPKVRKGSPINVTLSLQLYQIIQVNEPQQYLLLNAWAVERWVDQMLGWDPSEFDNETEIMARHDDIWLPDTTLYNSLEMDDSASKKLTHVKLTTLGKNQGAMVELLYPTIYKISCLLNLKYFPFDTQTCRMTFGSWSFDNSLIDYFPRTFTNGPIGLANFLENDAWSVLGTKVNREEKKYTCCPVNYTLLHYDVVIQRKPLYYVLNLIAPTAVITFISIIGFFTSVNPFTNFCNVSSSVHDLRQEKITLGITTLLSMSIMIFMVSDKMPSTSTCVPLIALFYTLMITIISVGTLAASSVIFVQKLGSIGNPPASKTMKWTHRIAPFVLIQMPLVMKQAYAKRAKEEKHRKRMSRKNSMWTKVYHLARDHSKLMETVPDGAVKFNQISDFKNNDIGNMESPRMAESQTSETFAAPMDTSFTESLHIPELNRVASSNSIQSVLKPTEIQLTPYCTRNIVELEWDWVAAVLERVFLIFFTICFLFSAIGINLYGWYIWYTENHFLF
ncbi:Betaine receptor acr-23 [Caenorhabditis elegans]|uniref:Betaine receptor acr-23 n=1 Tax=Caenorhabditis elegans TaxID=6239 RepID=ACH23_CAEEL|nr:Betaine receptor acr-23 [Caenorhabditis elegans]G5EG88.1 RecName: Full=Betaine receptor acr-23; AltName: Full=Acetylcholine receptor subunit alpha-type acr-23; Flags: Precursor [Caenorhabditis elegans]AAR89634.1 acetylcholine receptor (62.5 kD) (acr-23) [Caenorhabditis elegans]CCD72123.1 Betaine receptor acr-23 [Caenorhabditis elegans]|eukprot:NP_504024.2 Betaine receptor acr-23 [Caenorhabditis elegans]